MKRVASVILTLLLIAAVGCGFPNHTERKYLARIEESQTTFRIPFSQYDSVWIRAKRFVATYSSRAITIMNDTVISSEPSSPFDLMLDGGYGYMVTAHNIHDTTNIAISAYCISSLLAAVADPSAYHNVYILIDYVRTGSLPYPELISK
jgi:hypothetical protein